VCSAATAAFGLSLQRDALQGQHKQGQALWSGCEGLHFSSLIKVLLGDSWQIRGMFRDRRAADRHAVNTRAIIVWGNDLVRAFGIILDMSETGLRIRLDHEAEISSDGYILFDNRMEPFRVAWQANRSAGLQFTMTNEA
jgi:hypothetical protein